MAKLKRRRGRKLTIEDYEHYLQFRARKKFSRPIGLPAKATSNPRLEQCNAYYDKDGEYAQRKRKTTDRVYDLERGKYIPKARIIYTPMGGKNKY